MNKETQMHLDRGREFYATREFDKAEPHLLAAAQQLNNFADVMNMLGVINHDVVGAAIDQSANVYATTVVNHSLAIDVFVLTDINA